MKAKVLIRCSIGHETKLDIDRAVITRDYMRLTIDLLERQAQKEGGCGHPMGDGVCRAVVNVSAEIL